MLEGEGDWICGCMLPGKHSTIELAILPAPNCILNLLISVLGTSQSSNDHSSTLQEWLLGFLRYVLSKCFLWYWLQLNSSYDGFGEILVYITPTEMELSLKLGSHQLLIHLGLHFLYILSCHPNLCKGHKTQRLAYYSQNSLLPYLAWQVTPYNQGKCPSSCTVLDCSPKIKRTWAQVHTQLHLMFLSSSVIAGVSVTRPVPIVRLPSRRVKRWPFSKIIGCLKIRLSFKSSPGMASS